MSLLNNLRYQGDMEAKVVDRMNQVSTGSAKQLSLSEICDNKIEYHEAQIRLLRETKELLQKNQDFEKLLQNMNNVH